MSALMRSVMRERTSMLMTISKSRVSRSCRAASPELTFDVHRMRTSELTFRNVRRQEGCMEPAIRMLADGRVKAAPLVTHHFPLEKIEPAFEMVAAYQDGVIKAMLTLSDAE